MIFWPTLKKFQENGLLLEVDLLFAQKILQPLRATLEEHGALPCLLFALMRGGHMMLDLEKGELGDLTPLLPLLHKGLETFPLEGIHDVAENTHPTACPTYKRGNHYYLQKNWTLETSILHHLERLNAAAPSLPLTFSTLGPGNPMQNRAILNVETHSLSLLTGGPGTGKTFTAAQIIKTLLSSLPEQETFRILLTAPTGKAVAQLESALRKALQEESASVSIEAKTLHALLKITPYVQEIEEPLLLFADLILIDECSMIDAKIFAKLLSSIVEGTRLVLIGDKNQLPPVEAGSIFADLIDARKFTMTTLTESLRSDRREILHCAEKIQNGDVEGVLSLLHTTDARDLSWKELPTSPQKLHALLFEQFKEHFAFFHTDTPDPKELIRSLQRFAILSCMRKSAFGVEEVNRFFSRRCMEHLPSVGFWAIPIMIVRNDYALELFNGDMGVLVRKIQGGTVSREFSMEDEAHFPDRKSASGYRTIPAPPSRALNLLCALCPQKPGQRI